jgi:hypothetical protein
VLFTLARVRRADLPTLARWCEALRRAGDDHRRARISSSLGTPAPGRVRDITHSRRAAHAEPTPATTNSARPIGTRDTISTGLEDRARARVRSAHLSARLSSTTFCTCASASRSDSRPLSRARKGRRHREERPRPIPSPGQWFTGRWEADEQVTALRTGPTRDDQYRVIALYAFAHLDAHLGRDRAAPPRPAALTAQTPSPDALFSSSKPNCVSNALSQGDVAADRGCAPPAGCTRTAGASLQTSPGSTRSGDDRHRDSGRRRMARALRDLTWLLESPWALATASRSHGLLCEARGDRGRAASETREHAPMR